MTGGVHRTVLLVDDDENSRIIFSAILEHAGYHVITAERGDDGLDKAVNERPSVILLDIALPVFDGIELLRRLKDTPAEATPVIAVTGRAMPSQQDVIKRQGFCRVLLKPVRPNDVLAAIHDVLDERP